MKKFFDDDGFYCLNCGKDLNKREILADTGLCADCANKKRQSMARRRKRKNELELDRKVEENEILSGSF